jgi:hypothetical protein
MPTDMFAKAAAFLGQSLRNHASRSITISDRIENPSVSISLPASSGRSHFDEDEGEAVIIGYDSRDWLVAKADMLDQFGQVVDVKRGWMITDSLDNERYEIYAPPGVKPWKYSDSEKTRIRIHSRNIDT